MDSARQNLAATFVNALLNAGYGTDKLLLTEGNKWLYKNKEHGTGPASTLDSPEEEPEGAQHTQPWMTPEGTRRPRLAIAHSG